MGPGWRPRALLPGLLVALAVTSCGGGGGGSKGGPDGGGALDVIPVCEQGTYGCRCYPNDTCNSGFQCTGLGGLCALAGSVDGGMAGGQGDAPIGAGGTGGNRDAGSNGGGAGGNNSGGAGTNGGGPAGGSGGARYDGGVIDGPPGAGGAPDGGGTAADVGGAGGIQSGGGNGGGASGAGGIRDAGTTRDGATGTGGISGSGGSGAHADASDGLRPEAPVSNADAPIADLAPDVAPDLFPDTADAALPCATEGANQCAGTVVETCTSGVWVAAQSCPQGCADGLCSTGPVTCNAGEVACFGPSVKVCNPTGSAWLASNVCADQCQGGLCIGTCTAGSYRCSGSTRQVCNPAGSTWTDDTACPLGCDQTVCIEPTHANQGNVETLSGPHVYQGCFTMELGGSVAVPAAKTLEIWATCFSMTAGTKVTIGTGGSFIVHASDSIALAGAITGGSLVKLMAWGALNDAGTISSTSAILRGDQLAYATGAAVAGTSAALYGASFDNQASFPGTISVMPPESLSSVTTPDSGWWNWSPSGLDVSWPRPFPGVIGYYVSVGDGVPGPGNGTLVTTEHITVPSDQVGPGTNRIRVVSANPTSVVGTYPVDLNVYLNVKPPVVASSSHPVEAQWYTTPDVYLTWTDPAGAPTGTFTGYRFIFDHSADTLPTTTTGTFTTQKQLLLPSQSPGIWFFHIVNLDRLGRTSPVAAHYQIRIGSSGSNGNIAGHVDADGTPVAGVHVSLNGGLLNAYTTATGDYTFEDQVPALADPYTVSATLPGYAPASAQVQVTAGSTAVQNFTLTPSTTSPDYRLGWETPLYAGPLGQVTFAMGPRDRLIWSSIGGINSGGGDLEGVSIARVAGDSLKNDSTGMEYYASEQGTDVGWDGARFYALDTYACATDGSTNGGQGWSCLQLRTYDPAGQTLAGWKRWGNSGQVGSGSVAWNGTTFGTFFVSYQTLMFRELTSSLAFADGNGAYYATAVTPAYVDIRQNARARALWDGTGYGVVYQFDQCYFARYDMTHAALLSPTSLDACAENANLGLVFDGTNYQTAYVKKGTNSNTLVVRSITPAGVLGAAASPADLGVNGHADPSLAFDRRNLLLAYQGATTSVLEVRAPGDHSLVKSIDLGAVTSPLVSFNPQTAQGGMVYIRNGALYFRSLYVE